MIRYGLAFGLLVGAAYAAIAGAFMGGCYKSGPTPPCTVNSPNPGCPGWPHDAKKPR